MEVIGDVVNSGEWGSRLQDHNKIVIYPRTSTGRVNKLSICFANHEFNHESIMSSISERVAVLILINIVSGFSALLLESDKEMSATASE